MSGGLACHHVAAEVILQPFLEGDSQRAVPVRVDYLVGQASQMIGFMRSIC